MILYGKRVAKEIEKDLLLKISGYACLRAPKLAMLQVGDNPASSAYLLQKKNKCAELGVTSQSIKLPESVLPKRVHEIIKNLNEDPLVDGILLQLPLPGHLDPQRFIQDISPEKDVDGLHPYNVGLLSMGSDDCFIPCTAKGVMELLRYTGIVIAGKKVVIVGRSLLVGTPLALLLSRNHLMGNATVTLAHSFSENLSELTKEADILISATGRPGLITGDMVKTGAVVIDVGICRQVSFSGKNTLVGDVCFDQVSLKASAITPVPGGVGPLTVCMLLANTVQSFLRRMAAK